MDVRGRMIMLHRSTIAMRWVGAAQLPRSADGIKLCRCWRGGIFGMIEMLSAIGRVVIVVAAALMVIGSMMGGYMIAQAQESVSYGNFLISGGGQITPLEFLYLAIGGGIGLIVAGAVFGAIATLYDIRDSLRLLTRLNRGIPPSDGPGDQPVPTHLRREPRI